MNKHLPEEEEEESQITIFYSIYSWQKNIPLNIYHSIITSLL